MPPRTDAHAHFFLPGFAGLLPESCRRRDPDEITLYQSYAKQYEIAQVLAVGYEGEAWASGNNEYLTQLATSLPWVRPVAFVEEPHHLTVDQLSTWQSQRFVGISLYLLDTRSAASLTTVSPEIWQWLTLHNWLISINSNGNLLDAWQSILADHPTLTLLISHLGLPPAAAIPPTYDVAQNLLRAVTNLNNYPNIYVKFSGFYALSEPGYDFPHRAAWPYAEVLANAFGTSRILWASDFSPALEVVSFAQTVAVIDALPGLTEADRHAIHHDNLARLLAKIDERTTIG